MITVARRYKFRATHHIPELPGYDRPHAHDYTVEIVAKSGTLDGFFDTAQLDDWWDGFTDHEGKDLNEIYEKTTVEFLSRAMFASACDAFGAEVLSVTVWEDDDRWGRAE